MQKVELNLEQRIGLIALLSQQAGTLRQIMLLARTADKVELSAAEREAIHWKTEVSEAGAFATWDPAAELPNKMVELEDDEAAQLVVTIKTWPRFALRDRRWLNPLLDQLPRIEVGQQIHLH